ncbi:zinc finger, CCHC-type containing protein [Tanacetum coccineum]
MGDENSIHTLGDYFKPSHEGYRNTIELPVGNNVVPLRSDTIRLVQNECLFHELWSEDPNQHLKDFLKLVDSLDLNGENRERMRLEPEPTLEDEFKDLHLNLPVLKVLAHALIYNGSTFVQGETPAKMGDPGLFTLPYRLGDSKPFDTLADLGSCVKIIPLYLYKKLNIGLLEETDHIFGLADETKSYPVRIVKDVEVHIGKLKLLNDFYVLDMKKDPETPLLVGRGFLATTSVVIDCRMAKIVVGKGITRSVFSVKGIDLGEKEAPYWTTLGKRESYKPRPSTDEIGVKPPYYARKDFLDCHLPKEWEISRDA